MGKVFRSIGVVVILALAAYGAYSFTVKIISYVRYQKQYSSIMRIENIKNGIDSIPDFVLTSPSGNKVSIYEELKKKDFVIISFGSIYCGNCHEEYEALEADGMISKIPGNAEIFLAVPEEREFIAQFEKDLNIHIPLYVMDKNVPNQIGITKIPTMILVGKDRKIKMYQTGFKESTLQDMYDYIRKNAH